MSFSHRGFSAWITSGGKCLPQRFIQIDEETNTASCWIPGSPGDRFTICWQDHASGIDTCAYLNVDGLPVPGRFLAGDGVAYRSGVKTSAATERPFTFKQVFVTSRDPTVDAGTIKLLIKRVRRVALKVARPVGPLPPTVLGKRKAGGPSVELGAEQSSEVRAEQTYQVLPYEQEAINRGLKPQTFVSFVFRYFEPRVIESWLVANPIPSPASFTPAQVQYNPGPEERPAKRQRQAPSTTPNAAASSSSTMSTPLLQTPSPLAGNPYAALLTMPVQNHATQVQHNGAQGYTAGPQNVPVVLDSGLELIPPFEYSYDHQAWPYRYGVTFPSTVVADTLPPLAVAPAPAPAHVPAHAPTHAYAPAQAPAHPYAHAPAPAYAPVPVPAYAYALVPVPVPAQAQAPAHAYAPAPAPVPAAFYHAAPASDPRRIASTNTIPHGVGLYTNSGAGRRTAGSSRAAAYVASRSVSQPEVNAYGSSSYSEFFDDEKLADGSGDHSGDFSTYDTGHQYQSPTTLHDSSGTSESPVETIFDDIYF